MVGTLELGFGQEIGLFSETQTTGACPVERQSKFTRPVARASLPHSAETLSPGTQVDDPEEGPARPHQG